MLLATYIPYGLTTKVPCATKTNISPSTCYSRAEADHMWLWVPEQLDKTDEFQSLLRLVSSNPSYYFFHALYFEIERKPSKL
mgnify:CR=1 FL=1